MEGRNFHRVQPLDKELQETNDSWEAENEPLPGMNSLLVFQGKVISLETI